MSKPTITIEVSPTGETTIKTEGFPGRTCKDATAELERALGAVTSDTPTREMFQTTTAANRLKAGQ